MFPLLLPRDAQGYLKVKQLKQLKQTHTQYLIFTKALHFVQYLHYYIPCTHPVHIFTHKPAVTSLNHTPGMQR